MTSPSRRPRARPRSFCRVAWAAALAFVIWTALPARADPVWIMVPGAGVGRVSLGMKGPDLIATLGTPTAYCALGTYGAGLPNVTVLYYANRGLALTLSAVRGDWPTVSRIHVVAGYSATLTDEANPGETGTAFRKCVPNGTLTLNVRDGVYVTNSGIRPGSGEAEVIEKFGPPKVQYPAVAALGRLVAAADTESLRLHRLLLLPYPSRILAYDGIVFGIDHGVVVAITIDWTGFDPHRHVIAVVGN